MIGKRYKDEGTVTKDINDYYVLVKLDKTDEIGRTTKVVNKQEFIQDKENQSLSNIK